MAASLTTVGTLGIMLTFATKVGDSYKPSNARTVGRTALNFLTSAGLSFSLFGLAPSFLTAEQAKQCSANPANISEDFDEKEEFFFFCRIRGVQNACACFFIQKTCAQFFLS